MGSPLRPSFAAISREKVLPPAEDDIDRWIRIKRTQNALDDPYDAAIGRAVGFVEGLNPFGGDFQSVPSLRTSRDTGNFLGQVASNIPGEGIRSIGPTMGVMFGAKRLTGKHLRQRGEKQIEKVISEGLEKRSFGIRPPTAESIKARQADPKTPWQYHPNDQVSPGTLQALSIAQQRWPRLFGHLNDVAQPDALTELQHIHKGGLRGVLYDSIGIKDPQSYKLAKLGLNVKNASPDTVGHELLHLKDRILDKDMNAKYQAEVKDPNIGYDKTHYERRARAMGRRMREIVDEIENQGGKARDARGRNIRVKKLQKIYSGDERIERIPSADYQWDLNVADPSRPVKALLPPELHDMVPPEADWDWAKYLGKP